MNKWQDMFEVMWAKKDLSDNPHIVHNTSAYRVVYKGTTDLASDRWYGYEIDAKRGAAMIFRSYIKKIEKELLGS